MKRGRAGVRGSGSLGEFGRIREFFVPLAGPGGLGLVDDAALVDCPAGHRLVVTADAIVAGVHFLPDDPPDLVARKLLRVNLSDIAAMGARPLYYLLTTALPTEWDDDWVARFAHGLAEDQRHFGVALLGGDSVATGGPAVLSLTALGEVESGKEIRRGGAQPGDVVWVSGTIGDAFLGLAALRGAYAALGPEQRAYLIDRYRLPQPRVALGPALAGIAHAMLDVSDGLLADLGHVCDASQVAARVAAPALPLSVAAAATGEDRARLASAGDDYELLFTAPPASTERINQLSANLALPMTAIGSIEHGSGVRLVDAEGDEITVAAAGYRHF